MKYLVLIILLLANVETSSLFAQDSLFFKSLDSLRIDLDNKLHPDEPGAAIIITYKDKIVFENYYGLADLESKEKLNSEHVMGIASMSKQFEGMSVLMLSAKRKLTLQDNILKHLPELPLKDKHITVKQLLSHTSGLPELTKNENFMNSLDHKRTVNEIIDLAFTDDFRHEPGERYQYCNTGYTIVVALIEKLSGMSYAEYLKENIFLPLEMNNTYSCDYNHDAINTVPRYVQDTLGYSEAAKMHFSNLIGGGGMVSNVQDMARWASALLKGNKMPENYRELWNPVLLNNGESTGYGLGMGNNEINGHPFYYHPGMGSGMNSVNLIFPFDDLSITVIRNVSNPKVSSYEIALLASTFLIDSDN